MNTDPLLEPARMLSRGRLLHQRLTRLPEPLRPRDEDAAYALQARLNELLAPQLGAVAGHKIGCTTPVMQAFLGIDSPCAGEVFASTVWQSGKRLRHADYLHVGVECEIALLLESDLLPGSTPHTRDSVAGAVRAVLAGIEVVDDRYIDYKSMDTPTLIADDFFNAGVVLGRPREDWSTLSIEALCGRTFINEQQVGSGCAADVMGHPFAALAWLANAANRRGSHLRAGQFVMSGSVVETRWVAAGEHVRIAIDELGEVEVVFEA